MSIVPNRRFRETQEMTEPPYSKNVMWLRKVEEDRFLLMVYNMDTAAWVPITCVWDDILCKPWWTEQIHKIFEYDEHGDVVYDSDGTPKLKDNVEMLADNIKFVYNGSSETIRGWKDDDPKQYPDVTQTRTVWRLDGSDRYVEDTIQKFTLMPDAWNRLYDYYISGQYDMNEVIAAQIANEIGADDVMFAHWLNLLDENDKSCLVRSGEDGTYELITMNSNDGFVEWNTVIQNSVTDTKPVFSLDYIMEKLLYLIEQCECIKSHMDDDINNNNNNEEDMSEYATKAEVQAIQNQLTQLLSAVQALQISQNTQDTKIGNLETTEGRFKNRFGNAGGKGVIYDSDYDDILPSNDFPSTPKKGQLHLKYISRNVVTEHLPAVTYTVTDDGSNSRSISCSDVNVKSADIVLATVSSATMTTISSFISSNAIDRATGDKSFYDLIESVQDADDKSAIKNAFGWNYADDVIASRIVKVSDGSNSKYISVVPDSGYKADNQGYIDNVDCLVFVRSIVEKNETLNIAKPYFYHNGWHEVAD